MSIFAIILGALTGTIIPLVQSDNAEETAELYAVDEAAVFDSHYWGGWFHDWTLLYVVVLVVALVMWAQNPAMFKWVLFALFAMVSHLAVAYMMSWVNWLAGGIADYLGLTESEA